MQGANHAAPASSKSKASKDDSDSDDSLVGKSIKKKAPPKRAAKAKLCALFDVNFYRIVLGRRNFVLSERHLTDESFVPRRSAEHQEQEFQGSTSVFRDELEVPLGVDWYTDSG